MLPTLSASVAGAEAVQGYPIGTLSVAGPGWMLGP